MRSFKIRSFVFEVIIVNQWLVPSCSFEVGYGPAHPSLEQFQTVPPSCAIQHIKEPPRIQHIKVLVWIAETRIAEMIEIEEKPELPKRVYCTRPVCRNELINEINCFSSDKCVTFHDNRFNLETKHYTCRNWLLAIRADYAFGNPGFGNSGRYPYKSH